MFLGLVLALFASVLCLFKFVASVESCRKRCVFSEDIVVYGLYFPIDVLNLESFGGPVGFLII